MILHYTLYILRNYSIYYTALRCKDLYRIGPRIQMLTLFTFWIPVQYSDAIWAPNLNSVVTCLIMQQGRRSIIQMPDIQNDCTFRWNWILCVRCLDPNCIEQNICTTSLPLTCLLTLLVPAIKLAMWLFTFQWGHTDQFDESLPSSDIRNEVAPGCSCPACSRRKQPGYCGNEEAKIRNKSC